MNGSHVLIVEDESAIARGLAFNFEQEGASVKVAPDGSAALAAVDEQTPDCVVLDLMLPGMSGYDICEQIRLRTPGVPILVLSARTLSEDKARAFDAGCDQYMTKPFALDELISRVRNLMNRRAAREPAAEAVEELSIGPVRVDFRQHRLTTGAGDVIELTKMEAALLQYFAGNEGAVLSRQQISRDVWGQPDEVATRSIDNFVLRLRKQIEPDPSQPRHLLSVRGIGYRFVAGDSPAVGE